jgi:hypothetical protein
MAFVSGSRKIPRTDRPGSGAYRGPVKKGLAFDDFRASDEHEARTRHEKISLWEKFSRWLRLPKAVVFSRSPDNTLLAAAQALTHEPTVETSRIKLTVRGRELLVTGSVTNRWMKKKVGELLAELPGDIKVKNDLEIRPEHPRLPQEGALSP